MGAYFPLVLHKKVKKKGIIIAFSVLASAQVLFGVFLKVSLVIKASFRLDCTREGWFSPTPALIYDITPSTSNKHSSRMPI